MSEPFRPEVQLTRTNNGDVVAFTAKSMKELIDHINFLQNHTDRIEVRIDNLLDTTNAQEKRIAELEGFANKFAERFPPPTNNGTRGGRDE